MSVATSTTLVELFTDRATQSADQIALHALLRGEYRSRTWREIAHDAATWANALTAAGVAPGDRVIQIAENRYEWILADLAIHLTGAAHVAVHAMLSGPQMAFQILDTGARVVLVSGPAVAEELDRALVDWPEDVRFFAYEPVDALIGGRPVALWSDHASPGALSSAKPGASFDSLAAAAVERTKSTDLATILYSSGTTGEPKGVMLSHGNLATNAIATDKLFLPGEADVKLCWLPLSHIFARTCDLYCWIVCGTELVLAESRDTVLANCQRFRPTLLNGVPYFFDKVHRYVASEGGSDDEQAQCLTRAFGGRLQMACSGGAPLADATGEYFWKHGIPLVQGYGLTESSPVISVSTPRACKTGSVGQALDGVEIKIAADGEILTRGPHVMLGYWKQPEATTDAINTDGWLKTGDLGRLDDEGFLWITGRKKELIVTAAGKNIAPAYLERLLCEDPLVLQALVIGDRRNYLSALIVPNCDMLKRNLAERGLSATCDQELIHEPAIKSIFRRLIDERLAAVSHCEQIGSFCLLSRSFTIEHEELTPTLKLRRSVIQQHFAQEIEAMYVENAGRDYNKE